jgi:hypothetical protein
MFSPVPVAVTIMAVDVGFLVAWAVRTLGKGHTNLFGVVGGGCALLGIVKSRAWGGWSAMAVTGAHR